MVCVCDVMVCIVHVCTIVYIALFCPTNTNPLVFHIMSPRVFHIMSPCFSQHLFFSPHTVPTASVGEENVLMDDGDGYAKESILIHEMAHRQVL